MDKLNKESIKGHFKNKAILETQDIVDIYEQTEKGIKPTTVNWRVHSLVQLGVLQRIGRGKFTLGKGKIYSPHVSTQTKSIYKKLQKAFPFANFCVWSTSLLNEFMQHQPSQYFILIETEKEMANAVFYFLREIKKSIFLEPTNDILEKYIVKEKEVYIIKPLISEAPTVNVNGIETTSLEKMLVDVFCEDVVFSAHQGAEMRTIFTQAFAKFTINQSKLLRYAGRRRRRQDIDEFVKSISKLWQQ